MVHINSERKVEAIFRQICAYIDNLIYQKEVRLPEVIFFSGGAGSGQETQMNKICHKYGLKRIDTSALLSNVAQSNEEIKAQMSAGKLVDSDQVVNLIIDQMGLHYSTMYIIKGFPKSQSNLDAWNKKMNMMAHGSSFYFFNCSETRMEKRSQARNLSDDNL